MKYLELCMNFEDIEQLDRAACERQIRRWIDTGILDKSLDKNPELKPWADAIANQILALEARIERIRILASLDAANAANAARFGKTSD